MKFLRKFYSFIAFAILFAIFNLICFLSRTEYTTGFYISVGFGNFSLLLCFLTALFSFAKRQIHLVYSYYYLTSIYEVIAILLNLLFIWFRMESIRVNIIINAIVASIFLMLIFWSLAADADTNRQAKERTKKLNYHYDMCDAVSPLRDRGGSIRVNKKIEALYDAVANSQINASNETIYQKDLRITRAAKHIDELLTANADEEQLLSELTKVIAMVDERNEYVKNFYMRGV